MQKRNLSYLSIVVAGIFCFSYAQAALHFLPRYQGSYGARSQEGGEMEYALLHINIHVAVRGIPEEKEHLVAESINHVIAKRIINGQAASVS